MDNELRKMQRECMQNPGDMNLRKRYRRMLICARGIPTGYVQIYDSGYSMSMHVHGDNGVRHYHVDGLLDMYERACIHSIIGTLTECEIFAVTRQYGASSVREELTPYHFKLDERRLVRIKHKYVWYGLLSFDYGEIADMYLGLENDKNTRSILVDSGDRCVELPAGYQNSAADGRRWMACAKYNGRSVGLLSDGVSRFSLIDLLSSQELATHEGIAFIRDQQIIDEKTVRAELSIPSPESTCPLQSPPYAAHSLQLLRAYHPAHGVVLHELPGSLITSLSFALEHELRQFNSDFEEHIFD